MDPRRGSRGAHQSPLEESRYRSAGVSYDVVIAGVFDEPRVILVESERDDPVVELGAACSPPGVGVLPLGLSHHQG